MAMARTPTPLEKPLHWIGSAKKALLAFPDDVIDDFGFALGAVQAGRTDLVRSGVRTAGTDVELIRQRLKTARDDYEVRYGEKA